MYLLLELPIICMQKQNDWEDSCLVNLSQNKKMSPEEENVNIKKEVAWNDGDAL